MKKLKIGILGATGMVGKELIKTLADREFPVERLRIYASERSVGKEMETKWGTLVIENAEECDYSELDIAFFAISGDVISPFPTTGTETFCLSFLIISQSECPEYP